MAEEGVVVEVLDNKEEEEVTQDLDLIELYENEPCLWDISTREYSDKNERRKALERIDSVMKVGGTYRLIVYMSI